MRTIKSKKDFERVFTCGRRYSTSSVRIRVLPTGENTPGRVAFVAAKRLGNAVFRNRCKRVLREAARFCELPQLGQDVILFATTKTHDLSPHDLVPELTKALKKLRNSSFRHCDNGVSSKTYIKHSTEMTTSRCVEGSIKELSEDSTEGSSVEAFATTKNCEHVL